MWQQNYYPHGVSLAITAVIAAIPIFVLLVLLGVARKPAWVSSLLGLAAAIFVAIFWYGMPAALTLSSAAYGAAFGLFPIGWIVFTAILLYRLTVECGKFEIIRNYVGGLTPDHRLQALLIAFAFGAFLEGACGFGTPVAIAAAMLAGLGFSPFYAAGICLLANTSPVAFGAIGIPVVTLHGITGIPLPILSANVGRICAPISLVVPAYLVLVMSGFRGLRAVMPAVVTCGVSFAVAQILISNLIGPYLTDIIGSLAAISAVVLLLRFWAPADAAGQEQLNRREYVQRGELISAWMPYGFLVLFVLLWGISPIKAALDSVTTAFHWPALHNLVIRTAPIVRTKAPYPAMYTFNLLSSSGTACMFAVIASAIALRLPLPRFASIFMTTLRQLALALVTIAAVLALAFVMNYSGATTSLGLAFAATGFLFPFFSPLLGWLGVFLTGSDTSANALFGNLQVVTANALHLKPALMAAANSSGGVMGKMISLQSIAVAAAATGMPQSDEPKLFRHTLRHSIFLVSIVGLISLFYAYVMPQWVK
ncbi:MAG: lactate permease LctP family transporter [Acidobacteriaceae bacterium]|nr:lactate permease LctP family transporter [Acidobacteriaceae bacterium]